MVAARTEQEYSRRAASGRCVEVRSARKKEFEMVKPIFGDVIH